MFCIFYSKNTSYKKEKAIFKNIFPTINQWIVDQKANNHNALAIKMQKFESRICIDNICGQLDSDNIKYYTIHDAWLVDKNDIYNTIKVIGKCFLETYKTKPKLKTQPIAKP